MENGRNPPTGASTRIDWERNHEAIKKCIVKSLETTGSTPSYSQIVTATGLNLSTVKNHLRDLRDDGSRFEKFRAATEEVIIGMWKAGKKGDARAGKLFLQFVEGWEERKRITQVNQNPYVGLPEDDLRKKLAERLKQLAPKAPDAG